MINASSKAKLLESANYFLGKKENLTEEEIKIIIKNLQDTKNEINIYLKGLDETDWKMENYTAIKNDIENQLLKLNIEMKENTNKSTTKIIETALDDTDSYAKQLQFKLPIRGITEELAQATSTLTGAFITGFNDDLKKKIGSKLAIDIMQGKSFTKTAKEIADEFKISIGRAETIARTEFGRTYSLAQEKRYSQIFELNKKATKTWISSRKPKAREGHLEAEIIYNKNPIPIDEPFLVHWEEGRSESTKESMMCPGDPNASIENTINCGCVHIILPESFEE